MALTLSDLRSAVRRNLGSLSSEGEALNLDTTDLNSILNEASHNIEAEADWPWLITSETITTVAGTRTYTPTAGWYRTRSLTLPTFWALKYASTDQLNDWWPITTDTDLPRWYAVDNLQIELRPAPDAVYSLAHVYFQTEPELIDDGDEPLLPNQFRPRLVDMATAMAGARMRLWAVQQAFANKDPGHAKRMADDRRKSAAPTTIRNRLGTWNQL